MLRNIFRGILPVCGLYWVIACLLVMTVSSAWALPPWLTAYDPNVTGGTVYAVTPLANGKALIGGDFTTVGGTGRQYVAALNADGTVDPAFVLTSADFPVYALLTQPDGKILVGGAFTNLSGIKLARLNMDGSIDAPFVGNLNVPGIDGTVNAIALQPDGSIIIGGLFTTINSQPRNNIARILSTGVLDPAFAPVISGGTNVAAIAVQPDGKIVIGGDFTTVGGAARARIARLKSDGTLDPGFNPTASGTIYALAVQPNGKVLIGGAFTSLQPNGAASATSVNYLARLNGDGTIDSSFTPNLSGGGQVAAITLLKDGRIVVGGVFTQAGGSPHNNIVGLNPDGSAYPLFNASADAVPYSFAQQPDGAIFAAGNFTSLSGTTRNHVALLALDWGPITTASPAAGAYASTQSVSLTSPGNTIHCTTDGSIPTLLSPCTPPINIAATTRLRFFAVDGSGNQESLKTLDYYITGTPTVVPRTGQTSCYNTDGTVFSCTGTSQDGETQKGMPWPVNRFTDNGDQTITDKLTGLAWAKDGGTPNVGISPLCSGGVLNWQGALDYVKCLNITDIGAGYLGHTDWRLPNINELASLVNAEPAITGNWLNTQGYANVQPAGYWSSTTAVPVNLGYAWGIDMSAGVLGTIDKTVTFYAWPVRTGQPGALTLPQTGQTTCYNVIGTPISCVATGQDGELLQGTPWPGTRFTGAGSTLTDGLTGLTWTKDANLYGTMDWSTTQSNILTMNSGSYGSFNDWRLPTILELLSLINHEQPDNATWLTSLISPAFVNVSAGNYWSSTMFPTSTLSAFTVSPGQGTVLATQRSTATPYLWPVRGGVTAITTPVLAPSATNISFGNVMVGNSGQQELILTNNGDADLVASNIQIVAIGQYFQFGVITGGSNPCASLTPTIAPGTSCTVLATTTPAGMGGISTQLQILSNSAGSSSSIIIPLSATGIPMVQYTVTPSVSTIGGVNGAIAPNTAQSVNSGATTSFTVTPNLGYLATVTGCGGALAVNTYTTAPVTADCTVTATFSPDPAYPNIFPPAIPDITANDPNPFSFGLIAHGGVPGYVFSLTSQPAWVSVSTNGLLTFTNVPPGNQTFTVDMQDSTLTTPLSNSRTYSFNAAAATAVAVALPQAAIGQTYIRKISLPEAGTTPPYSYSLVSGSLPTGLSFTGGTSATISGTPTTIGTATFTIKVQDSAAYTYQQVYTLTVADLALIPVTIPDATVGVPYNLMLAGSGGTGPYTVTMNSAFPPGMSINAGTLMGTPTQAGTYLVEVVITDSNVTPLKSFQRIKIQVNDVTINPPALPEIPAASTLPFSFGLSALGGVPPYLFSIAAPPAWLTVAANGTLTFTNVPAGQQTITIKINDNSVKLGARSYTFTPVASGAMTQFLQTALVNQTYSQTFPLAPAAGGTPYNYSIFSGSLPPGITIASSGASASLNGTPTANGSYSFTIQVKDSAFSNPALKTYTMTVVDLVVTPEPLPAGTIGSPYNQPLTIAGGTGPYTVTQASAFPAWLTLSGNTLSGTPASAGKYQMDIVTTDSTGGTPLKALQRIEILVPAPQTLTVATAGAGTGTIASTLPDSAINCGVTCSSSYAANTVVTLTATPSAGSVFTGWYGGGCSGTGTCTVTMSAAQFVSAGFRRYAVSGANHSVLLKSDGTVWTWGSNSNGQLGNGTTTDSTVPLQALGLSNITAVSAGLNYTVALKADGTVWAWGRNNSKQLGDGTTIDKATPFQVSGLANVTAIAAGQSKTLVLKNDGTVWDIATMTQVSGLTGVKAIVSGGVNRSSALKSDGTVWTISPLAQVSGLTGVIAISADNASDHVVALKSDGTVWTWGTGAKGQLGDGTFTASTTTPTQASGLNNITAISAGNSHSLALKNDGSVWTWGTDLYGQLGDGLTADRATPAQLGGVTATAISAGINHSIAVKNDGTLWAWGWNIYGQLADGTTTNALTPLQSLINASVTNSIAVSPASLPNGTFGLSYNQTVTGSGGVAPYNYAVITGALPPGLALNAASGVITGVPVSAGSYTFTIRAIESLGNYGDYGYTVVINQATPAIIWGNPAAITYGTALTTSQLNASASVPGTYIYTPASGVILNAGAGQALSVTFTPTDSVNYSTATATVTLTVNQITPLITWANPAAITYGTALSTTQLNATASVPGTFVYTPASGVILNAGVGQSLSVSFTPTDSVNYATPSPATAAINVIAASQTITFGPAPSLVYQGPAGMVTATGGNSGNPVTFISLTPTVCTISGAAITPVTAVAGSICTIAADQTGNGNYAAAARATQSMTIKTPPVVTWSNPVAITYGTPLSAVQLNAAAAVPGTFAYSPASGTILNSGAGQTLTVTFTPDDSVHYSTQSATVIITVNPASQAISTVALPNLTYGGGTGPISVTGGASGLPVTLTSLTPTVCGTSGNQIIPLSAGTCTIIIDQAGNGNYAAATGVTQSITIAKATPVVTWANPADITYGTRLDAAQLNATASVPGTFAYTPTPGSMLNAGAGQTLAVTFTPTDTVNYTTQTAITAITVAKAAPVVKWANPADITYGTRLADAQLNAAANVPGTFAYTPTPGSMLNAGAGQALAVTFTPADTVNYTTQTATAAITVAKATPVITWATPADITYGAPLAAAQLNATTNIPGTFSYTPALDTVLNAGAGQILKASFTPTDTANYVTQTAATTITVAKATPVVNWNTPGDITYGTLLSAAQLNATATVAGVFVYSPASGALLNAGAGQTLSVIFTPADSANYTTVSRSVNLTVNSLLVNQIATGADGRTTVPVSLTSSGVNVTLGSGILLSDAAGNPISGTLAVTASLMSGISSLPPSLANAQAPGGGRLSVLGNSIDITISAGSALVKNINPPMVVNLAVPPAYATPGSVVSYFSFDGSKWNLEGTAIVKPDGTVDMLVGHLSVWAVAKFSTSPGGDVNGDGSVDIADALKALQIAVGMVAATTEELARGDVAPLVAGVPTPNGVINVGDALVILQKAVGLVNW
jgi:uncharacterized delta-60 repeat protein